MHFTNRQKQQNFSIKQQIYKTRAKQCNIIMNQISAQEDIADQNDRVKFEGSTTSWPIQKWPVIV